jgi:hypothetical protein
LCGISEIVTTESEAVAATAHHKETDMGTKLTLLALLAMALPALGRDSDDIDLDVDTDRDPQSGIVIYNAATGGTACDVLFDLEGKKLKVEFDGLNAELLNGRGARETCMISLSARWPKGARIVISNVKMKGNYALYGARGTASAEVFTTGGAGEVLQTTKTGGAGHYSEIQSGEVHTSGCSGSGLIRVNANVRVNGNGYRSSGVIGMDKLSAELTLEPCH